MGSRLLGKLGAAVLLGLSLISGQGGARKKPYRLPSVDIQQRVLWGAECRQPESRGIAFGGQDQESEDGRPHTRLLVEGQWQPVHEQKDVRARARFLYLRGLPEAEEARRLEEEVQPRLAKLAEGIPRLIESFGTLGGMDGYGQGQTSFAVGHLKEATGGCKPFKGRVTPETIQRLRAAQLHLELAAEALDAEPPPRALSPIVYDEATGLYVLFGGDHLDYLTHGTWVFDPKARKWRQRHPPSAPAPRANHTLRVSGSGQVTLAGGYTYASNTDYCGGQYLDLDDGEYVYDIQANAWKGARLVPPDSRTGHTYQSYAFDPVSKLMVQTGHPDHFYLYDPDRADWIGRGPKPKAMRYNS